MRSIVITVIAIFLIAVAPQIARAKHTYVVQQWPEDMAKVPCSAFKRHPNGTWTEVAVFDLHGNRFTGNTYPTARERLACLIKSAARGNGAFFMAALIAAAG